MTIALPVAIGSLPIGATPVRFKQTQAPVAALRIQSPPSSSSASVDWVKVTDGEFFQTDSRPIMLFDGNTCCACAICATVESDLFATMIATGLMVLSIFFFVFPLFSDGNFVWYPVVKNNFFPIEIFLLCRMIRYEALQSESCRKLLQS
ncbi:hypothetical protein ZIOFF_075849 [Zingiber officinale]|uniref:Uncharacterized protein n=1 Tax=Zingiber officinale TaxID=94328 RepID=A0A8J5BT91_ZINOF|nr:hypothetical protein ZIOFF_075849 [Zingiber officinale]